VDCLAAPHYGWLTLEFVHQNRRSKVRSADLRTAATGHLGQSDPTAAHRPRSGAFGPGAAARSRLAGFSIAATQEPCHR
jgi:hypothetical protein